MTSLQFNEIINFRNSSNDITYAMVKGLPGSGSLSSTTGVLELSGSSTSSPCYFKNGRLVPNGISYSLEETVTLDLTSNNNHHITASAVLGTINLTNLLIGQSGHIVIKNNSTLTHNVTWLVGGASTTYIKWNGGSAPTLSSTTDYYDIISYYVFSTTEILMVTSTGYYC